MAAPAYRDGTIENTIQIGRFKTRSADETHRNEYTPELSLSLLYQLLCPRLALAHSVGKVTTGGTTLPNQRGQTGFIPSLPSTLSYLLPIVTNDSGRNSKRTREVGEGHHRSTDSLEF